MSGAYGRTHNKPGRPKLDKAPDGPACEICRCLRTDANGELQCAAGRILDPQDCPDYRACNKERPVMWGGTSGAPMR